MQATTDPYLPAVLASAGPHLQVPQGWPLVTQGDASAVAYVVISGTLLVTRDGEEIGRIGPGELAGELGLLRGEPRNASITAATPVEVIAMDRTSFETHRQVVPALRDHLERTHSIR